MTKFRRVTPMGFMMRRKTWQTLHTQKNFRRPVPLSGLIFIPNKSYAFPLRLPCVPLALTSPQGKLARASEDESRAKALHEQQCAVNRAALLEELSRSRGRTRQKLKSKEGQAMEAQVLRVEELARDDRIRRVHITEENYLMAKGETRKWIAETDAVRLLLQRTQARERVGAARLGELRQAATAATVEAAEATVQAAQAAQAAEATAETPGRSKMGAGT
eukprot:1692194-Pleurochrysis_carterae.AAC.1